MVPAFSIGSIVLFGVRSLRVSRYVRRGGEWCVQFIDDNAAGASVVISCSRLERFV